MKVSVNWLKELVDIELSIEDLAHALTMAGLEVEETTTVAAQFDKIVVAEVKKVVPHPNADKLRVTEVDAGTGALLQIVCGAPNVAAGMRVPCALVGAKLPDLEIKQAKLRGVESNGMLCSARELGISDDHGGLMALPGDAPIGQDIRDYLDLDDVYFTLKLTPNRGDCLSMFGIARDLAAVTGAALKLPAASTVAPNAEDKREISLSAPKACGRYCGRIVRNLDTQAPTPEWMKRRLERAGFRSIAPLVDITNYLTLERGRPMHAFDNAKLTGGINVRFARDGEEITLLNEQRVDLQPDMLLIADDAGPVALAGVMGGLESMVTGATRDVFFEAAYFEPDVIRGKTRTLNLNSDAAYRFERGVDPQSVREGLEYATQLALDICGTTETRVGPVVEAVGELPGRKAVMVRPARANALIGMNIPVASMIASLKRLNCNVVEQGEHLLVTAPTWRFDLTIEEEFIEEIARIEGYEKVPAAAPLSSLPMLPAPESSRTRTTIRRTLAGLGYQEVISYSFIPAVWESDFAENNQPVRVANPIAAHMEVMRSGLIGGLVNVAKHNLNHGESRLQLFEIGRCFLSAEANVQAQPERVAGFILGSRYPEQWGEDKSAKVDFFDIKGDAQNLLQGLPVRFEQDGHPALHPGRAARIVVNGERAGFVGELHPKLTQKYGLPSAPLIFELDLSAISTVPAPAYQPISRMPAVRRDIAVLVDDSVSVQAIIDAVLARKMASLIDFSVFDLYRGANLEAGRKSVAFRIVMQDTDRTLTDSETDQIVANIVEVISQKFGATLRK